MNEQLVTLMPLIILIVIMYFLLIRPQKKREKAIAAMKIPLRLEMISLPSEESSEKLSR
jgi:preprotein translocase subunit YajC